MSANFFPPRPGATPTIYAFASTHPDHAGLLKVGCTDHEAAERVAQQFPGGFTGYDIKLIEPAMRADGSSFTDCDVHRHLRGAPGTQVRFLKTCSLWGTILQCASRRPLISAGGSTS